MSFRATKTRLRKEHDRSIRAKLREKRKAIGEAIRTAKKRKRSNLSKVREQCRRSFARLRVRADQIRAKHRELAREEIAPLRDAAVRACAGGKAAVSRVAAREVSSLKASEREARAEERRERNVQGLLRQKDKRQAKAKRPEETDEEVAYNLEPELRPVWEQMKGAFRKPPSRKTRTEAFLEWVHDNAAEVAALQGELQEAEADEMIEAHEREQRAIQEALDRGEYDADDLARWGIEAPPVEPVPAPAKAARKAPKLKAPKRINEDAQTLRAVVVEWGDLKEPEAAAALNWSEARVWKASDAGLKAGLFERSKVNGALHVPGEPGKQHRLSDARMHLQLAEKKTGVAPVGGQAFIPPEPEHPAWVPVLSVPSPLAVTLDRAALAEAVNGSLREFQNADPKTRAEYGGEVARELLQNAVDGATGPTIQAAVLPVAWRIRVELRRQLKGRLRRKQPSETFADARRRIAFGLSGSFGFENASKDGAKTPKFVSRESTVWLKPQAVYVAHGPGASLGRARSLLSDMRGVSAAQVAHLVEHDLEPAPF